MQKCIYTAHCAEFICDKSCPILAETSYLLERNDIPLISEVFVTDEDLIIKMQNVLKKSENKFTVALSGSTVKSAELLTYCAICQNWKGNRLHCNVYNLKFSKFIDLNKKSWSSRNDAPELEYIRVWSDKAKILIISNIDFVTFGDFESQTLLNLIQNRQNRNQSTILVSPVIENLNGKGLFFTHLQKMMTKAVIN